ncbi:MAG: FAD-dependent oxidoreductase [Propionibacteriaceae bacterium]|nr:FAD-dependent oxidoreductase [Propionibacteriaceae bacterium]
MKSTTEPVEIVVLGGGYVGLWSTRTIARGLRDQLARGRVRLTLISAMDHHAFHGWTAEVITGDVLPWHARVPIEQLVPESVRRIYGEVTAVDLTEQRVTVTTKDCERQIPYRQLVIAVGSRDARDRIPGLRQHGWSVKDDGHLGALNLHLAEVATQAVEADPAERERLLTAVVAGGGLAGTEMASAILDRLQDEVAARPELAVVRDRGLPRVVLVHSHDQLVADLHPKVGDYATRQLLKAGIAVRYRQRLAEVTSAGATLDDGSRLASATVLSALGQDVVQLGGTEHLPRDERRRLITDDFLQVVPGVWAGGDVAAVPRPNGEGEYCRSDALWAIAHGKHLGGNVARAVSGQPQLRFDYGGLGRAASLGVGAGAGELHGVPLIGWPSWLMRWVLFHWFMPSRRVALRSAAAWFRRTPWPALVKTPEFQARMTGTAWD